MFDDDPSGEEYASVINKGWLIIFTDRASLLLAFFVLLFSMSSVESDAWKTMTESLSRSLSPDLGILKSSAGPATLSEKGKRALRELGSLLRNVGDRVDVFGHTDPTPPQGGGFSSNWELSISRAITAANELRRAGCTKDIPAFGAAESHSGFLSPEFSGKQRTDLSRRVDIVVLSSRGDIS